MVLPQEYPVFFPHPHFRWFCPGFASALTNSFVCNCSSLKQFQAQASPLLFCICKIVVGFSLETKAGVWGKKKNKKREYDVKEELLYEKICFLPDSCAAPQAAQIGQVVKSRPEPSALSSFLCLNASVWGMNCNLFSLTHSCSFRV